MTEERGLAPSKAEILWGKCLAWLKSRETIGQDDMESDGTDPISLITAALDEAHTGGMDAMLGASVEEVRSRCLAISRRGLHRVAERLKENTREVAHDSMWGGGPKDGG